MTEQPCLSQPSEPGPPPRGQCVAVRWELAGIQSLYINRAGKAGHGEIEFCPAPGETNLVFAITAAGGQSRDFTITIHPDFPSALISWLPLAALLLPVFIASYFLGTMRLSQPITRDPAALLALAALLLGVLLWQALRPATVAGLLDLMERTFTNRSWQLLGAALAGTALLPLVVQALRLAWQPGRKGDLAAAAAFFLVVLIFAAPAGLESIAQWETWQFQAYFEGRDSRAGAELVSRFWLLVPGTLGAAITPDSFAGHHLVNFAMHWGILLFFYAVLRQLRVPAWLAFLATILLLVYPVNFSLMTTRSFSMAFGKLTLLAAMYLALDCREIPSRWRLLSLWLLLLLNVGSNELAFGIIVIAPLFWWRRAERAWLSFNLALIWYLALVFKLAHYALLDVGSRNFYGSRFTEAASAFDFISLDRIRGYVENAAGVYHQASFAGWQDALSRLGHDGWIVPAAGLCRRLRCWRRLASSPYISCGKPIHRLNRKPERLPAR